MFLLFSLQWLQLWLLFCQEAWGGWGSWHEARKECVAGAKVEGPERLLWELLFQEGWAPLFSKGWGWANPCTQLLSSTWTPPLLFPPFS